MNIEAYFQEKQKKAEYLIEESCCVGCGRCKMSCPEKAIKKIHGLAYIEQDICMGCGTCMAVCPHGAIRKK